MKLTKRATTLTPESIDSLRSWLCGTGKSPHTAKGYCTDLKMFLADLGDPSPVGIEEELEELGMAWLTKHRRTLAPRTTARRLTSLREFCKWAGYPDMFLEYKAPDAGQAVPHPIPEGMAGVRRLLAATGNEKQQGLVALCGMAGLRLAEALSVSSDDFKFKEGGDRSGECTLRVRGKGDVTRYVPISEECLRYVVPLIVRAWTAGGSIIPLNERFARRCISDLGVRARLSRRIASHDLRATFATALYNQTKDQRLVQVALGHKSGRTTEGYIGVEAEAIRRGIDHL